MQTKELEFHWGSSGIFELEGHNESLDRWAKKLCLLTIVVDDAYLQIVWQLLRCFLIDASLFPHSLMFYKPTNLYASLALEAERLR